jgi:hypothetical protein
MICEHCEASVPMVQQRFDMEGFRALWVCMRCAPGFEAYDGFPVRGELSDSERAIVREIGWEAYRERRRLERKNERQRRARAEARG